MTIAFNAFPASAAQGQWGGFIYLFSKKEQTVSEQQKQGLARSIHQAGTEFGNDFFPEKGRTETILYLKPIRYTLNGKDREPLPSGFIRVESMDRKKVERFYRKLSDLLADTHNLEFRLGVTQELKYTDKETLQQLKEKAPRRGDGKAQPNAVVFPLSKTEAWWSMTQEQRQSYFFTHPDKFGPGQRGHNAVGFDYIQRIFRKLFHSRFIDSKQDFVTYFEYADSDSEAFTRLLEGLRDPAVNPEWKFVTEEPILYGRRVADPKDLF